MKTRKIALLAVIAVLAGVCVLQIVFSGGDSVREVKFTGSPDSIVLSRGSLAPVSLVKDGDKWLIGDKKYPADGAIVERMLQAIASIRCARHGFVGRRLRPLRALGRRAAYP